MVAVSDMPFEAVLSTGDRAEAEDLESIEVAIRTMTREAREHGAGDVTVTLLHNGVAVVVDVRPHEAVFVFNLRNDEALAAKTAEAYRTGC
jgi:hypothetical protein